MKLKIVNVTHQVVSTYDHSTLLNRMLCRSVYNVDDIIEYFKMYPDVSLGSGYYFNDAITLLCSYNCAMKTPDIIKILDHLLLTNDVNAKSNRDYTPLLAAVENGDLSIVEYLVSKGAKFIIDGKVIRSTNNMTIDDHISHTRRSALRAFVVECIYKEVTGG